LKPIPRLLIYSSLALAFLGSGCASRIRTQITPFYQELPNQGKTFFVYPLDTGNIDSPEFFHYAGIVAENLEKNGLKLASKTSPADYVVILGYGIDPGVQKTYSYNTYGQTGGGSSYSSGNLSGNSYSSSGSTSNYSGNYSGFTYTAPTFGVTGSGIGTRTEFTRGVYLAILEIGDKESKQFKTAYQSRGRSVGSSDEIAEILPSMIKAMFKAYPGVSGKTETHTFGM